MTVTMNFFHILSPGFTSPQAQVLAGLVSLMPPPLPDCLSQCQIYFICKYFSGYF